MTKIIAVISAFLLMAAASFAQGTLSDRVSLNQNGIIAQPYVAGTSISQGQLVKLSGMSATISGVTYQQVTLVQVGATSGVLGVATQTVTSGQVVSIALVGQTQVLSDNACSSGSFLTISSTTNGNASCTGTPLNQSIGQAFQTTTGAGLVGAAVNLGGGNASGGGGGGGGAAPAQVKSFPGTNPCSVVSGQDTVQVGFPSNIGPEYSVNGQAGCVPLNATDQFDVLGYGAKGDGTTSDTTAVATAYAAACAAGGTVYFPASRTYKFAWPTLTSCAGWVIFKYDGVLSPTNTFVINQAQVAVIGGAQSTENGFFNQWPNGFITPGTNSPVISITTAVANPVAISGVGMDGCVGDCIQVTNGSNNVTIERSILRTSVSSTGSPVNIDMTASGGGFNFWLAHDSLVQESTGPVFNTVATGLVYLTDSLVSGRTISASNVGAGSGVGQIVIQRVLSENLADSAFITFNTTAGQYSETVLDNIEIADRSGGGGAYLASNAGGTLKISVKNSRGFATGLFNEISGVIAASVDDGESNSLGSVSQNNDSITEISKGALVSPTAGHVLGDFSGITNTTLAVRPVSNAKIAEQLKGLSGQTGDLLDALDFNGNKLSGIDGSGNLYGQQITQFSTYTVFLTSDTSCRTPSASGTTVCARNNATGKVDYSSTDTAVVVNDITAALATVGGRIVFKNGVYPVNSMTAESATGCSNFGGSGNLLAYAFGFPSNTPYNASVQWFIEGEASPVWVGETGVTTANASGVIFNITATAVSSVAANSVLTGFWQRPITNCTFTNTNTSNDLHFKNVGVRFPANTRGNEIQFASWFAGTVQYENVLSDFAQPYNTIATGSAPTVGSYNSIGITSAVNGSGNWQDYRNTYAVGSNLCYDWTSEHITVTTATSIYCNVAGEVGRVDTQMITHPIIINHFVDQENLNGLLLGPSMAAGSRIDIFALDMEFGSSNWYARTGAGLVETNQGYTSGIISYTTALGGTGIVGTPDSALFTSGGQNFQVFEGTAPVAIAKVPAFDSFTHPNGAIGPAWIKNEVAAGVSAIISSNAATTNGGGFFVGSWAANAFNADQFSKVTLATISTTGSGVLVRASPTAGTQTYYAYYCTTAAGRAIERLVAGTATSLVTTASNCVNGDSLELDVIGSTLIGYYTHSGATTLDLITTDTNITSGGPGIFIGTASDSLTNWRGGSFATKTGTDSIYSQPMFAPTYGTITNCKAVGTGASPSVAACGSAAAGRFSCATNATGATCQVNTTAVTANSEIFVQESDSTTTGTLLGVTCNSSTTVTPTSRLLSTWVAGTSFTINLGTVTTNPACFEYNIVN